MFPVDKKWWRRQKSLIHKCINSLVSHKLSHDHYSGLHPKQGYRSPGNQKNVCRMYRVRTSAHSRHGLLPPTTNRKQENHGRIKQILVLRYLIHFLAKSLIWDGEIHCEHLLRAPNELFLHRQHGVAVFCWGLFMARAKLEDLASGSQRWALGTPHDENLAT
jgi:hypothetical protein